MGRDIHRSKKSFERIEKLIKNLPDDPNGVLIKKYLEYHKAKLNSNKMSYSGVTRSLNIAYDIIDKINNVGLLQTKPLEDYWSKKTQSKVTRRLSNGKTIMTEDNLSEATLQKHKSQTIKFYKFAHFLTFNKPLSLFNSLSFRKPDCCEFLVVDKSKKRKDFPPINQKKVGELIEHLTSSQHYYERMAGVLVALANDFGGRFTELIELREKDIRLEEDYYVVHITESKTAERYVICRLAKPILKNWIVNKPRNKAGLLFPSFRSKDVSYNCLRKYLVKGAEKVGLNIPKNKSFHFFRHLCSSRLVEMPPLLKKYFMGWEFGGMDAVYSHPDYKACKKYYFESIKDNPLLDKPLSYLEEQETKKELDLSERVKAMEKILESIEQGENLESFARNKFNKEGRS